MILKLVILAKLLAQETDTYDYTTYVFKVLEEDEQKKLDTKYIMCTKRPNWDHRELIISEVGYLEFREIQEGVDKWYDGKNFVSYRYSAVEFQKFISKVDNEENVNFKL